MLVAAACLLALLAPLAAGRSLRPMAGVRLRGVALVWSALVLQAVALGSDLLGPLRPAAHLATYALVAAALWLNRRVPGLPLLAAGGALNGVTIALNDGTLPASPTAERAAGLESGPGSAGSEEFTNSAALADPVLPWLGDVFAFPAPLPLANVYSVGDVLVVAGVAWGAYRLSTPRRQRAGRAPTSVGSAGGSPADSDAGVHRPAARS